MKMTDYLIMNAEPREIKINANRIESCRNEAVDYSRKVKAIIENSKDIQNGDAANIFMERCSELNNRLLEVVYETLSVRNALLNAADIFEQIEKENMASFDE